MNPYRDFVSTISPLEYERCCFDVLKAYAETECLSDLIIHNTKIMTDDGEYSIDIYAEFVALSVEFEIIV